MLSAHEYKRVVTMDSSTFPRLQRRDMGWKLPGSDFFLFGLRIMRPMARFQTIG